MRLRGVLLLAAAASVGAALMLAGPASAANLHCGQTLTSSVTLIGNLDCSSTPGEAIIIGHDGVTFNLNGFKITGYADDDVIDNTGGYNSVTVKGGTLVVNGDGNGVDNTGNNLTVAGVTITGNGTPGNDAYGVYSDDSSGLSFTGGSVSGVDFGFYLDTDTGDLIKGNTITPNDGGDGVFSEDFLTGVSIVSNKFTDTDSDQTGIAYYGQADAGTLFSGNTVTKMEYGVYMADYDAGITITGNVMDGNKFGLVFADHDSGDMISGNYIKNSVEYGVYDEFSFNNAYTGNVLTSNGSVGNYASYFIYPDGYGPVTMVNNYARTGNAYGFQIEDAYNSSVPGGPYTLMSGNVATANGSTYNDPGFSDDYSVGATWSKNVADYNASDGFYFDYPWRETITGNAATMNGGDGFTVVDNSEDYQPLAVTNNSATYNGEFGFWGEYPVAGSGNTGKSTNSSADCYLVAGCS